jgi:hypothetical protein
MYRPRISLAATAIACSSLILLTAGNPCVAQSGKGGARAGIIAVVARFEQAYKAKDKKTLLMKLMVPTHDDNAIEKRYQWLRGYGPKDMPGTKHPPILFESSKGSFVPGSYKLKSVSVADAAHGSAVVEEQGSYQDEDGKYRVTRSRTFKLVNVKGVWYVADYVLPSNTEDYGFYVDDIADKMKKL